MKYDFNNVYLVKHNGIEHCIRPYWAEVSNFILVARVPSKLSWAKVEIIYGGGQYRYYLIPKEFLIPLGEIYFSTKVGRSLGRKLFRATSIKDEEYLGGILYWEHWRWETDLSWEDIRKATGYCWNGKWHKI